MNTVKISDIKGQNNKKNQIGECSWLFVRDVVHQFKLKYTKIIFKVKKLR